MHRPFADRERARAERRGCVIHELRSSLSLLALRRCLGLWLGVCAFFTLVAAWPLPAQESLHAAEAKLYVQMGHSGAIYSVAFAPNGRWVLTGGWDGTARVWDIATGREIRRLEGDHLIVSFVAFSPDGRTVLSGTGNTARQWDVGTGRELQPFEVHSGDVKSVAFFADGPRLLTVSDDGQTPRLWEMETKKELQRFKGHSGRIYSLVLSPDGRKLLTGGHDKTARIWEVSTGKELRRFVGHSDEVTSVAFSPDGRLALTGSSDKTARVWDVATGKEIWRLEGHSNGISSVAFSPDGRRALTGSDDKTARVWDVVTGKEVRCLEGHSDLVLSVAFSPDGRWALTAGWDHTARVWDLETGKEIRRLEGHSQGRVNSVASSPDGHWVMTGSEDKTARVWDLTTGKEIRRLEGHSDAVRSVAFSPDGRWALTGSEDKTALLWETASGQQIRSFTGHTDKVTSVAFSDGDLAVTGSDDQTARLWEVTTGKNMGSLEGHSRPISSVAATSDGRWALTGSFDGSAGLWDLTTGQNRSLSGHSLPVTSVALSLDGLLALTGSWDDTARVWEVATGKELQRLNGHSDFVMSVAFSPNGRWALTGSVDDTARVWEVATGKELQRLKGHSDIVHAVAFSPDGRWALTGSEDGTTRLWDAASGNWLATLVSFREGGWAVVDPEGRFDTNDLDGGAPLHWIVDDDPMHPLPLEIFMRDYYTPRLLARILGGEKLPPLPNIAQLNRVQPLVETPVIESRPTDPDRVRVRVKVAQRTEAGRSSGAQDLRIFRDGQLVKLQEGPLKDGEYVFDGIRLPSAESVEFTAYAFNSDRVKSETAHATFKRPGVRATPEPKTFVINIGVNRSRAEGCNLKYAVSDATNLGNALQNSFPSIQRQLLVSADDAHLDGASKGSIRAALAAIARQATPDDIFVLSYSGHGYTDEQGVFYLFPSDLKGSCANVDAQLKTSAISSEELTEWVRPIDAGEMVMILDACYSAASVESGEFKPGPMGNHGLGQLAYDKRIRILAASQSTQAASETPWLGMGLLSFGLTKDGLEGGEADWQPKDGKIWLREWLAYGVERVPKLYEALRQGKTEEFRNADRGFPLTGRSKDYMNRSLQTPALFDFRRDDQQGIRLK